MVVCSQCRATHDQRQWQCPACGHAPAVDDGIPLLAPQLALGDGGDADYLHQELSDAETRHFWFVARKQLIAAVVRHHFPNASSMLDVGCGTGGVAESLRETFPSMRLAAGDVLINGLRIARRLRPKVDFVQFDLRDLPYESEFDVIGAFDVIEHLDEDVEVLKQMRRATRPGGGVIITVPQHQWLWSPVDDFSRHRRRYSRHMLVTRLVEAGFRVERVTSFMAFLLPALIMSRLCRSSTEQIDPNRELRISPMMNAVMAGVCDLERAAIHMGVSLPAGGSLLAVGRRSD